MKSEPLPEAYSPIPNDTYRKIVLEIADGIIGVDMRGFIRFANPAAEQIFGWRPRSLKGEPLSILLPESSRGNHEYLISSFREGSVDTRRMGQRGSGIVGRKADGSDVNLGITILKTDSDGEPLMIAVIRDISEQVRHQQELTRLAETDHLTGLLNRRAFFERAEGALAANDCKAVSVILLDLDHFKLINDMLGHDMGDQVIQGFARTIQSSVDCRAVAARLGGEEFAVLLQDTSGAEAVKTAEEIRRHTAAGQFFPFKSQGVVVTVSGGVASVKRDLSEALKRADIALYQAKHAGRDRIVRSVA